nr:MAG TPA: hypothetical protein [Caudoviricetes sp.]
MSIIPVGDYLAKLNDSSKKNIPFPVNLYTLNKSTIS